MGPFSRMRGAFAALATVSLLLIAAPAGASAQAFSADRVRVPLPAYDGTLTPYTFALGYPLVTLVYDTLLLRDADGIPQPWLARSIQRTDDGRRLTVRLREGVRWHDGPALTAADVVFTFRFVASHYHARFTSQLGNVERVRATGRLTLRIDLRHPSLGFDDQPLADLPILPRHRWQGLPARQTAPPGRAVGSGPYRLVRAQAKRGYVLRANRGYFHGVPRVREIQVPIIGDADRTYAQLRRRRIDMVPLSVPDSVGSDLASSLGIALRRGPSYTGTALVLNVRRPSFDSAAARRAVAGALDVGRIARSVAPAVAADEGFLHPASRWSPGMLVPAEGAGSTPPDLKAATVRVLAPRNDPVRLEAGRRVVLALRNANARASLVSLSQTRLEQAVGADGSQSRFDAAIQSIPALVSYDPDYLTQLFGSGARGAALNVSGYRSATFDALARRVASAREPQARRRAVRAELELLARDVPAIPLFFSQGTFAYRPAIYNGWVFVKGTGILDKRSFLPAASAGAGGPQRPGSDPPATSQPGSGISAVDIVSIVVLALVAILVAIALVLRRRSGAR